MRSNSSPNSGERIVVLDILQRAIHNAEMWELHRFRGEIQIVSLTAKRADVHIDALLENINVVTKPLDSIDVTTALQIGKNQRMSAESILSITATYRLLLCIPTEYLTRNIRNDLLRRALAADVAFTMSSLTDPTYSPLFFREFLRRIFSFMGNVEHPVSVTVA